MNTVQKILFTILLLIPIIEIFLLIEVGSLIGVIPTLLLIIITAALGAQLMRQQGLATWQRLQVQLAQGIMPATDLVDGLFLLLGGALLLTPGFFTDSLGFACLIPSVRQRLVQYTIEHRLFKSMPGNPFQSVQAGEADALEGEFKREDR